MMGWPASHCRRGGWLWGRRMSVPLAVMHSEEEHLVNGVYFLTIETRSAPIGANYAATGTLLREDMINSAQPFCLRACSCDA